MTGASVQTFGGNRVRHIGEALCSTVLAEDAYVYRVVRLDRSCPTVSVPLATGAIWVLEGGAAGVSARCGSSASVTIGEGDAALFDGPDIRLECGIGHAIVLLAGTSASADTSHLHPGKIVVHGARDLTRVDKPWGEELWINGRHPTFAFKRITLRAGQRTSLQYHRYKRETNLLLSGLARLHYLASASTALDAARAEDIDATDLRGVSVVDVWPLTLHRIEAVTDLVLFEVSTPHLDDVIRVSDDAGRGHGLIASEHRPQRSIA